MTASPASPVRLSLLALAVFFALFAGCDETGPAGTTGAGPEAHARPMAIASAFLPVPDAPSPQPSAALPAPSASAAPVAIPLILDAGHADAAAHDAGAKTPQDAGPHATADVHAAAQLDAGPGAPLAALPDAGAAAPLDAPAQVAKQVDAIFLGKKTFQAHFTQELAQKVSGTVKKASGVLYVERPNKISFHYEAPNKNRIVSDGVTLKAYVAEDQQMFEKPVGKTEYPGALAFLMGKGISSSFSFTFNDKTKFDAGPVLLGKPLQTDPAYQSVMFYIDRTLLAKSDPGAMRGVLILDPQGNKNRFEFQNVTQPAAIDPNEFIFTPPPGTTTAR